MLMPSFLRQITLRKGYISDNSNIRSKIDIAAQGFY